jgi:two-component system response regulator YesN
MGALSHILVVDDEIVQLFVLQEMLSRASDRCQVETASSAWEALDKVRETRYDLILTDLRMPGMSGVALTEAIRALDPQTIVVWITAYGCHPFRREAERLGVYWCLEKPVGMDRIHETVREALRTGQRTLESI